MRVVFVHPLAWVGWLAAVLVALSSTRNPLHMALILLCIATVHVAYPALDQRRPTFNVWQVALIIIVLSALLNALSAHIGTTVLFTIPAFLPLIGGPFTVEALVFGAITGATLAGMIVAFGVAQRSLPTSALIGLIPRAFYPLAVVSAIAVTFVPTTLRQATLIREAQQIRGFQMRRLRDWLPLLMPLLVNGLERSMQLAEAIASRGFASADRPVNGTPVRALLVTGLVTLLGGWLLYLMWGLVLAGQVLMLLGAGVLVAVLWWAGRQVPRTRYQRHPWAVADVAILVCAALVVVTMLVPLPGIDRAALAYYPYPSLRPPPFERVIGVASLGLLAPIIVRFW